MNLRKQEVIPPLFFLPPQIQYMYWKNAIYIFKLICLRDLFYKIYSFFFLAFTANFVSLFLKDIVTCQTYKHPEEREGFFEGDVASLKKENNNNIINEKSLTGSQLIVLLFPKGDWRSLKKWMVIIIIAIPKHSSDRWWLKLWWQICQFGNVRVR